jgi:hypothetical protein
MVRQRVMSSKIRCVVIFALEVRSGRASREGRCRTEGDPSECGTKTTDAEVRGIGMGSGRVRG